MPEGHPALKDNKHFKNVGVQLETPSSKYLREKSASLKQDLDSGKGHSKHQCSDTRRQRSRSSSLQQKRVGKG